MAVGVKVVNRPGSLSQQAYLPAIAEGLGVTFRHFMKNFSGNFANMFVKGARAKTDIATIEYPEEKKRYPDRHRGLHRLMLRDDGQVRCVAASRRDPQPQPDAARRSRERKQNTHRNPPILPAAARSAQGSPPGPPTDPYLPD